jgi:3-dehydroquinate synthase
MPELERLEILAGPSRYPVLVGRGALAELPAILSEVAPRGRLRVLVDRVVAGEHGAPLQAALERAGRDWRLQEVSGLERDKNLEAVSRVYDWLLEVGTERSDLIVAIGGGVVGDLVGFAAATFLRGLRLIHVPSTLLAMVDSSIGGKTGVDHRAGKNLIGAFYQPTAVLADLSLLDSLPRREVAAGWAEVIKMGMIRSIELFERLESQPDDMLSIGGAAAWAIARAISLKGEVVAADERESDVRMLLNYGHTIGHALEAASGYERYLHGEAVAVGMVGAAKIAGKLERLSPGDETRQNALLARFDLPTRCPGMSPSQLWEPMRRDKKAVGQQLRWVLPSAIGTATVEEGVPEAIVDATLAWLVRC